MAGVHRAGPLTRRATAAALLVLGLAACDLPGAHSGDAAVVNGHAIPRARWEHLVEVLKGHVPVDLNSDPGKAQLLSIQTQSLQALVREEVIEEMAHQRNLSVSSAEIDAQLATLAQSLGGQAEVNRRLDLSGESPTDIRNTVRINLLQAKMKAASPTYQADFDRALAAATVSAYVTPCDNDHSWPACAGGKR